MNTKISLNLIKNWQKFVGEIVFSDVAAPLIQNKVITVDDYQSIVVQNNSVAMENFLILLLKKNEEAMLKFAEILKQDYSWMASILMEGYIKEEGHDEVDASPITRLNVKDEVDSDMSSHSSNTSRDSFENFENINSVNKKNKLNNSFNALNGRKTGIGRKRLLKSRIRNDLRAKVINSDSFISSTTDLIKPSLNEAVTDEVISIIRKSPLISKSWTTLAHALGLTDKVHEIRYKVVIHGEDLGMCVVYLLKDWLEMVPESAKLSKLIEVLRSEGFNNVSDKLTEILYGKKVNAQRQN